MKQFLSLLVFFLLCGGAAFAQQREIKGVAKDGNGNPLVGANVVVAGTTNGTTTTAKGEFTLTINKNDAILKISYLGYKNKSIPVSNKNFLSIVLNPEAVGLNEVVAIGYGTQKKADLTGAVSSVSGKDLAARPVMRASEALEGLASGVTVTQTSGQPGSDGGTIEVRGIGTLGNSNPLVLIDGVEGSLDGVNPNDIESISVLKDAASAAIYGSRAANGVILVTTKKGSNEKLTVNYNAYFGWQMFTEQPDIADGYDYMKALNQAYINQGETPLYSDAYLQKYLQNKATDPDDYPDVNWQKMTYTGSGFLQSHYLSVTGGSKFFHMMGSISYQDQKGVVPNFRSQRYSFRFNSEMNIKDNFQVKLYLVGRNSPTYSPDQGGDEGIIYRAIHTPPVFPAILSDGRYGVGWAGHNPVARAHEGSLDKVVYGEFRGTIQANYQPFTGADIELSFTPNLNETLNHSFDNTINTYNPGSDVPAYTMPPKNSLSESFSRSWENTGHLLLNYKKSFKGHNVHLLLGYEQIGYNITSFSAYRDNFPLQEFQELNAGSIGNWQNAGTGSEWALRSEFGRLNYNFKGKYLFEANLRRDGSSRFAEGHKYGVFPSFSAGWRISEENFMRNINWLSNLKIRASWGQLGNQLIGTYPFVSTIDMGVNYILGGVPANGAAQTSMANPDISWETTTTQDIGADIDLFNDKFNLTYDYYIRNTTGILLQLPTPAIIGLTSPFQNAGTVKNTGWDLSLNYVDQIGELRLNIGANLSDVINKVTNLKGTGPYISTYSIIEEGYPINSLYGYKAVGLFQNQQEVDKSAKQFGTYAPGDIKYDDLNGDGVINASDRQVIGNQIPRYTYGLNLSLNYKNFDLYVLIQGVGKRNVFLWQSSVWAFYNSGPIQEWQLDSWTPTNPNAKYPRLEAQTTGNNFMPSSWWVYNAAYTRLKTLQIGYSLPKAWIDHLFFTKARIYVSGDNLFTIDHMPKGWDPEMASGDGSYYPVSSTYTFGINLSF